ncbi:hypothetical protein CVT24_003176 [Panaeolus cyanescens]|uniref:tRNA (uracil-O(2)-)-methyltransferase n=1 Tax=Panaeolus cyanescens TaxID=181874 RepID=A0A409VUB0_9AGAR|nr:hypothetical protein CVT24_003176 [Panaeolus cyanescens]
MAAMERPKYNPIQCQFDESNIAKLDHGKEPWVPLISCSADFPIDVFEAAIMQLIHHPEYNSTLILRSEVLRDDSSASEFPPVVPSLQGMQATRCIHRRLLPRRPGRDAPLEQYCTLYNSMQLEDHPPDTLLLTPIVEEGGKLPYYHPNVHHIAFRYLPTEPPTLRIEVCPLPGIPWDPDSRLFRTSLALLEALHRYGWGAVVNYKKRVKHDCLIPREDYQDLYLVMRERHKHLIDTWQEVTDPLKHVFEDIGIATYLMLLWKITFSSDANQPNVNYSSEPWKQWPQPPGGFLDFGCGNGLLTHILVSEGYQGYGVDLRARTSWSHYPETTQEKLQTYAFDPSREHDDNIDKYFKRGVFIIGNHADELTPWVPVISSVYDASGYLSIPCCSWAFDAKFERSSTPSYPIPDGDFVETLNLGGDGNHKSSYSAYRIWLASLTLHCGWEIETETLRIPSTRNWALIGRRRNNADQGRVNAQEIIDEIIARGLFKSRKPEGKAGDH